MTTKTASEVERLVLHLVGSDHNLLLLGSERHDLAKLQQAHTEAILRQNTTQMAGHLLRDHAVQRWNITEAKDPANIHRRRFASCPWHPHRCSWEVSTDAGNGAHA